MIRLTNHGVFLNQEGESLPYNEEYITACRRNTMTYSILKGHNTSDSMENLKLRFDALVSPDNNYVSILQTVKASGVERFPIPYVLSNCHNTLCAVGGTINEDDHVFGLDNVRRFGGIFVPPYKAVIHQYMREMMAGGGRMILGSDSHTRYGALGTLAIGEGGGEIAKQLLSQTYDIKYPPVVAVKLTGKPRPGVGPQDVALTLIGATFSNNFNKNKLLEFVGDGIANLSVEYRMGIDLSKVECMMALPYHPSHVVSIHEFNENPEKYLREAEETGQKIKGDKNETFHLMQHIKDGKLMIDQALVSGCSGGLFENIADWPVIYPVGKHLFLKTAGAYKESVTTDDLSPSGDAVAYRSNPLKLADFTMINKDPSYASKSKEALTVETVRREGGTTDTELEKFIMEFCEKEMISVRDIMVGSVMAGIQIGDGSSREQAASSQKILGGYANIAEEFATKRYRSNLINWGILPIISKEASTIEDGDILYLENVPEIIESAGTEFTIKNLTQNTEIKGDIGEMTREEKAILRKGCLINYNRSLM